MQLGVEESRTLSSFPVTWRRRASRKRKRAPCGYLCKHCFNSWSA